MHTATLINTNQSILPGLSALMQHLHSAWLAASEWTANSMDPAHTVTGKVISHHYSIQDKDFSNRHLPSFIWYEPYKEVVNSYFSIHLIGTLESHLQADRSKSMSPLHTQTIQDHCCTGWLDSGPNNKLFSENQGFILLCGMRAGLSLNLAPFRKDYPLTAIGVGRHWQQ